jgi:hypothetical protein
MLFLCVLGVLSGENRFDRVYNIFSTSTDSTDFSFKSVFSVFIRVPEQASCLWY